MRTHYTCLDKLMTLYFQHFIKISTTELPRCQTPRAQMRSRKIQSLPLHRSSIRLLVLKHRADCKTWTQLQTWSQAKSLTLQFIYRIHNGLLTMFKILGCCQFQVLQVKRGFRLAEKWTHVFKSIVEWWDGGCSSVGARPHWRPGLQWPPANCCSWVQLHSQSWISSYALIHGIHRQTGEWTTITEFGDLDKMGLIKTLISVFLPPRINYEGPQNSFLETSIEASRLPLTAWMERADEHIPLEWEMHF